MILTWQVTKRDIPAIIIGYLGVAAITINTMPAIVQAMRGGQHAPISSILLMVFGLVCCLYNSVKTGATLYTVANSLGLASNLVLLIFCNLN